MRGSDKQLKWAHAIRRKFERFAARAPMDIYDGRLGSVPPEDRKRAFIHATKLVWDSRDEQASWWIENRDHLQTPEGFVQWVLDTYKEREK